MNADIVLRRRADLPVTPWRNGGGRTREILVNTWPDGAPRVRVSMAEVVQDGPFSHYPGVARVLTLLTGDPLELTVDGQRRTLAVGEVLKFPGGVDTDCRLTGGPVEDLGVMTWGEHGAHGEPALLDVRDAEGASVGADDLLAVVTAEPVRLGATALRLGDSVQVRRGAATFNGAGRVAVIGHVAEAGR